VGFVLYESSPARANSHLLYDKTFKKFSDSRIMHSYSFATGNQTFHKRHLSGGILMSNEKPRFVNILNAKAFQGAAF